MNPRTCARLCTIAVGALVLAGCATRGSVQELRGEAASLRAELQELKRAHEASTRELAKTVGELKAVEGQLARAREETKESEQQVGRIQARLAETEEALRGVRAALDGLSRDLVRQATAPAPPRENAPEPGTTPKAREWATPAAPVDRLYTAALASFRAREHGQAILEFTDFIARYPQHPLAQNAQFWIAEAYYVQRDYRQALVEYHKVAQMNTQGGKAPDALLKIGLCLRALNEPDRAQETWGQLLQAHPESEAARQARVLLGARLIPVRRSR